MDRLTLMRLEKELRDLARRMKTSDGTDLELIIKHYFGPGKKPEPVEELVLEPTGKAP